MDYGVIHRTSATAADRPALRGSGQGTDWEGDQMNVAELTFEPTLRAPSRHAAYAAPATSHVRARASFAMGADRNERPTAGYAQVLVRTAVLLTTVVASLVLILSSGVDADNVGQHSVTHVVQPGDTLWDLAGRYTAEGGDVRATVSAIRQANGLAGSTLPAGAAIQIPSG